MQDAVAIGDTSGFGIDRTPFADPESVGVADDEVNPRAKEVEGAGRVVVAGLAIRDGHRQGDFLSRTGLIRSGKLEQGHRPGRVDIGDLVDDGFAAQPLFGEGDVKLGVRQLHQCRHEDVGRDRAMVPMGAIVGAAAKIAALSSAGVVRIRDEPHVAVATTEILVRVVGVPVTVSPLVVLILPLAESESVERFGDELFVTRPAVFRSAEDVAVVVGKILSRVGANEKVGDLLAPALCSFPDVLLGRRQDVVGVCPAGRLSKWNDRRRRKCLPASPGSRGPGHGCPWHRRTRRSDRGNRRNIEFQPTRGPRRSRLVLSGRVDSSRQNGERWAPTPRGFRRDNRMYHRTSSRRAMRTRPGPDLPCARNWGQRGCLGTPRIAGRRRATSNPTAGRRFARGN